MINGNASPVRVDPNPLPAPDRAPPSGSSQGRVWPGITSCIAGNRPDGTRGTPKGAYGTGGGSGGSGGGLGGGAGFGTGLAS